MDTARAIAHFASQAIVFAFELAQLLTIGPLVLMLVGVPCVVLFYWFRGLFIRE